MQTFFYPDIYTVPYMTNVSELPFFGLFAHESMVSGLLFMAWVVNQAIFCWAMFIQPTLLLYTGTSIMLPTTHIAFYFEKYWSLVWKAMHFTFVINDLK